MNTFTRYINFLFFAVFAALSVPICATAEDGPKDGPEDAILILDASGSMWGQIEGQNKITIARGVISQLLDDLPTNRRLGLMAYGHNQKGDCTDIEMIAKVGTNRAAMKTAVKNINPKGKTPISASVKQAAELLKYTENKATVILISDGIETCNLDPCALGKQLEKDGIDFTAHVVGFDIVDQKTEEQLQCLASSTGGRYLSASSASDLSIALGETVKRKQIDVGPVKLHLQATILENGDIIETGLNWKVQQSGGGDMVYESMDTGAISSTVPPGVYDVFVSRPSGGLSGESRLVEIRPGANKTVSIALNPEFEASVTPDRKAVGAGTEFSVAWTGPNRKSDFLTVTKPDAPARGYTSYAYTGNGNPLTLTAPIKAGEYEVRYVLSHPYKILARTPITVNTESASVKGPQKAPAGSTAVIEWTGPATVSDFVTITPVGAESDKYQDYFYTKNKTSPGELKLPVEPGLYEIRYVFVGTINGSNSQHRVIAQQEITVEKIEATLEGPTSAVVGSEIEVAWGGLAPQSGDFITITAPDAGERKYLDYAYSKNGSPAKITMPLEPGAYELRFVQNNKKVIARQPITITDVSATLNAPTMATVDEEFSVGFVGPTNRGDWLTIVKPDAKTSKYGDYFYARNGSPQMLAAPKTPGIYEIRYVLKGKRVLARQRIEITQ